MNVKREAQSLKQEKRDLADLLDIELSIKNTKIEKEWRLIYEEICK